MPKKKKKKKKKKNSAKKKVITTGGSCIQLGTFICDKCGTHVMTDKPHQHYCGGNLK